MFGRFPPSSCTYVLAFTALLGTTACGNEASSPNRGDNRKVKHEAEEVLYCGGETTESVAREYFQQLNEVIEKDLPTGEFDRFVGQRFSTFRDGRYLVFVRDEVAPVTPMRISRQDWSEIARRGIDGLSGGNYRGCSFDHGKVWFEGYGDTFELSAINHDLDWEE